MRITAIILGIILLGLGVWVAAGSAHYNKTEAKLGPIEASSQQTVPAPIGYAGIVIGGVLIIGGALKKKA